MGKRFGQHLLKNKSIAQKITALGELAPEDVVVEIGPGRGILTQEIIKTGVRVIGIEIDREFCSYLNLLFHDRAGFTLIEGDCLKIDWKEMIFSKTQKKIKVISNLPYYLTAPILFKLFEQRKRISLMVLTMQLEVARRLVAKPFTKDYGILSIATQFSTLPFLAFKILPGSFLPPPKVSSGVVKMRMKENGEFYLKDEAHFFMMVRTIFNQRRKMLNNTLKDLKDIRQGDRISLSLRDADIDGTRRPETLSLEELYRLYKALYRGLSLCCVDSE